MPHNKAFSGSPQTRRGFTLVELLVVIAIVGVLIAMLLPAIQAARESARRTECINHLKQIGLAFQNHHDVHKFLPTGGWGWGWTGDPDRGYGKKQPGGWAYNILPFLEQGELHDLGKGRSPKKSTFAKQVIQTPLGIFYCPSRRAAETYTTPYGSVNADQTSNEKVAKTDYGANCGDPQNNEIDAGPGSLNEGDTSFNWGDTRTCSGISFRRSTVRYKDIIDGASKTYMVGEKHINAADYANGLDASDNEHLYAGYDNDNYRTGHPNFPPVADVFNVTNSQTYGSAHVDAFHVVFCDGSVTSIPYTIDPVIHRSLSTRRPPRTDVSNPPTYNEDNEFNP